MAHTALRKNSMGRRDIMSDNETGVTSPVKLVIFDCDGVLVDSEIIACRIEAEELTRIGYEISTEENIRRFAGKSQKSIMETVERALGRKLPEGFPSGLHEKILKALSEQLDAMPGIESVLAQTPAKCVASSGAPDKIGNSLRTTGLDRHFNSEHIFSAVQVKEGKPAPDLFLYAAEKMGTPPSECVVIEDSVYGVKAAKAAGMTAYGFTGGSHITDPAKAAKLLRDAGADTVFDRMEELPELVGRGNYA